MFEAVVRFSEGGAAEESSGFPPELFGVISFVVLMVLLFAVTRFDPNR
jgi:hypothetical protein